MQEVHGMIKLERFLISKRPYAASLAEPPHTKLHRRVDASVYWYASVQAVWFRRRDGRTMACVGRLWDFQDEKPKTVEQFLERHDDGRYGGSTEGRWDGVGYWGSELPGIRAEHLELLEPMLEHFPEVPPGFDGWWTFSTP
jgi:hypothetical protein